MKNLFLIIISLAATFFLGNNLSAQNQKLQNDLEERNGVFYLKSDGSKYTGVAYTYHDNGKRAKEITYKKGQKRKEVVYYENGDLSLECEYKKGKRHGDFRSYYKGRKLKTEGKYKKGKKKGKWIFYKKDGSVAKESRI